MEDIIGMHSSRGQKVKRQGARLSSASVCSSTPSRPTGTGTGDELL